MSNEQMIWLAVVAFAAYKFGQQQATRAAAVKTAADLTAPLDPYAFLGWQG